MTPPGPPTVRAEGGIAVVELTGALDHRAVTEAARALRAAVRHRPRGVLADLSSARMGPDGLVVLAFMRRQVVGRGLRFAVAGGPELVPLLDDAHISALYRAYPSVPAALRAIGDD